MVRLSIRSNFGVTFTQIHNMRETIVADATRSQRHHLCLLSPGGQDRGATTAFPLMIPALQARGKQCTTAVDRTPALRQHAEQLMFARQTRRRRSKEKL